MKNITKVIFRTSKFCGRQNLFAFFYFCSTICLLCNWSACRPSIDQHKAPAIFQDLLKAFTESELNPCPGVSASIYAPDLEVIWSGAAGLSDVKKESELSAKQSFRAASITKTFVATCIMVLQEEGLLHINDPIQAYISESHRAILIKGGYDPGVITIKQCMNHTSGLFDFAVGSRTYLEMASKDANKRWTRTEQLEGGMAWGEAYGKPGEKYHYSDTGYILLGEIIERLKGQELGYAMRSILNYKAHQLDATYLESLDETIPSELPQVRRYFRWKDYTDWDNSIDLYGGGGLVSTTADLARFYYDLFNGQFFKQPTSLATMLEKTNFKVSENDGDTDYRLGFFVINVYGEEVYMHTGFWGTFVYYIPHLNAAIAVNFTREHQHKYLIKKIIADLQKIARTS